MTKKCVCGHRENEHHSGPLKEMKNQSELDANPKETRTNCTKCVCPRFKESPFF